MIILEKDKWESVKNMWKYRGRCFDIHSGKIYMFCSNSESELNKFRNSKSMLGMRYKDYEENPKYKVVRKLMEDV